MLLERRWTWVCDDQEQPPGLLRGAGASEDRDERVRSCQPGNRRDRQDVPYDLRQGPGGGDRPGRQAHQDWAGSTTVEERSALLRRIGELHLEQRERLGEIIVREMGKPIGQATAEVDFSAAIYEFYAGNAAKLLADEPIELLGEEGSAFVRRSSLGVLPRSRREPARK